ncbi:SCO6880 family protein [Cellulomonas soli]|uniref:PrgI family protein n=1 Tax=Cellulomonas soli TaxID=931535 RepID=A0A512P9D0_9CELL|nr:SCO6880 family protein [Cellulomonas soli]NYI60307.1 hypothetical protein [Cellulomonas soli]GEP67817.1 hypothetical protein CSO01_05320 [Cellulomonas soli]
MSAPDVGPTTRFGRLETRGVLLGLSGTQLAVVGTATVVAVVAVYSAGMSGLVVASPVWATLLVAGSVSVGGRPVVGWVPLLAQWHARKGTGATSTVATAGDVAPGRWLTLPGLPGRLELVDCDELGGVLVLERRTGTVTGVLRATGTGFVLEDAAAQEHKVAAWGRALAVACQQSAIVRVQVLVNTRSGGLAPARRWWREHCNASEPGLSAELAGMLDEGFVVPHVRETFVAIAVRAPRGRRRLSASDLALVARHLESFGAAVQVAGLRAGGWIGRADLARVLRAAYEPGATARAEETPAALVGSPGVRERWGSLATGTGVHATYWVSQWPRTEVHPAFLQPLLLGEATDRTVTLVAEPLPTAQALREIRRAKVEHAADAAQRARIGQIEDESTRAEVADLERREAELVAGHGDLRFTGLITVSASGTSELEERCAAMESAAAQAMCEVRRLVGQQGVAHAAACLPLARGVL